MQPQPQQLSAIQAKQQRRIGIVHLAQSRRLGDREQHPIVGRAQARGATPATLRQPDLLAPALFIQQQNIGALVGHQLDQVIENKIK